MCKHATPVSRWLSEGSSITSALPVLSLPQSGAVMGVLGSAVHSISRESLNGLESSSLRCEWLKAARLRWKWKKPREQERGFVTNSEPPRH